MKLAEALMERADLNTKIEQLRQRLRENALVQDGEQTNEDPSALLKELTESTKRLSYLISRINLTNCSVMIEDKTITEIIAQKDSLLLKQSVYRDLLYEAGMNVQRARNTEIKIMPAVNVAEIRKEADVIAKEIRVLDNKLQMTNWTQDLME